MKLTILVMLFAVVLSGCNGKTDIMKKYDMNCVLKISVLKSGEILAEGNKVSLQELDSLLAVNAQKRGIVWYYREAGQKEPPPQATQVIQLVIKHKRPIRMSTKPDFSDAVDAKGRSQPAK
jgi:hypothetical protein